jgi:hypothetical protein
VNLTGLGFTGVTAVKFGTVNAASFTFVSDSTISAVSPPGTGTVQVTVTTPSGTSNGVPFTYVAPPVPALSGVTPNQGPSAGGTSVALTGSGFTGVTAVKFGTVNAASFTFVSDNTVFAVSPPGTGTVQVTVTTPNGTSSQSVFFTYITSAPTLTSVVPNQGPAAGGNTVTLTGTNLNGATAVTFGSSAATSFTVVSPTQINATAPAGSGTVQVTVSTPGGTSNGVPFTYVAAPTLSGAAPNQGPVSGGNTVTLTGTSLSHITAVAFGTSPAAFTAVSDTQLTSAAPPGSAGLTSITVTNAGGTSNSLPYTRVPAPAI